jgi:hypothetical protein
MKKLLLLALLISSISLFAQDEGKIVKRERIERDKNIFVGGGISSASSLADYSIGVNFEGGFVKRVNRVFSIGGSISYLKFDYDPKITSSKIVPTNINTFPSNFYYVSTALANPSFIDEGYLLSISGSNLSVISIAANIKVNFVPIKESTKVSVYGFAKPFVAKATSSGGQIRLDGVLYNSSTGNLVKDPSSVLSENFEEESVTTGGIFIGPGIEFLPNNPISFFLQASFGYTFPVDQSSIKSLSKDFTKWPNELPVTSTGFTSINFAGGISFNLD